MATTVTAAGVAFHVDSATRGGNSGHSQIAKLGFGDAASYDGDVSQSLPLPVSAAPRTDVIQNSGTQLTPAFSTVSLAADGNILAAQTGKIRVLAMTINNSVVNEDLNIEDGSGGTTLWTCENLPVGSVVVLPFNPVGWFETTAATALYADMSADGNLHIAIVYVDVV